MSHCFELLNMKFNSPQFVCPSYWLGMYNNVHVCSHYSTGVYVLGEHVCTCNVPPLNLMAIGVKVTPSAFDYLVPEQALDGTLRLGIGVVQ